MQIERIQWDYDAWEDLRQISNNSNQINSTSSTKKVDDTIRNQLLKKPVKTKQNKARLQ